MLLRNKDTREEFHAPSGIAKALIATGTVEEVLELPPPEITVRWSTQRGRFIGDYEAPPLVTWSASNGEKGYTESTKGTAHKTARVFIPGARPNTCPGDVAAQYLELFAAWAAKSKKRKDKATGKLVPAIPNEMIAASTPTVPVPVPNTSPWSGATTSPWRENVELRNK